MDSIFRVFGNLSVQSVSMQCWNPTESFCMCWELFRCWQWTTSLNFLFLQAWSSTSVMVLLLANSWKVYSEIINGRNFQLIRPDIVLNLCQPPSQLCVDSCYPFSPYLIVPAWSAYRHCTTNMTLRRSFLVNWKYITRSKCGVTLTCHTFFPDNGLVSWKADESKVVTHDVWDEWR